MPSPSVFLLALAAAAALASLGGAFYEFAVVDPFWPQRPDLIQPNRGGISRRRFWIPAHTVFEVLLVASLVVWWSAEPVRTALLTAFASHGLMRAWSGVDFIPKALRFERTDPANITLGAAQAWCRRSKARLPLDLVTCGAMLAAMLAIAPNV
jgi:hypothetical protein